MASSLHAPTNPLVGALLTDLYQLTMTYAHWAVGKAEDPAVFELFFRKNPFRGAYTVFCGLDECLKLLRTFGFTDADIEYLKQTPALAHAEDGFWDYLAGISDAMGQVTVSALAEGTIAFPRMPLITIEGPLGIGHLLETTLLNLVNYPSLLATNASRMVCRAGGVPCLEFGLRRAQGPDGACTASKYSYVGGFVGTSNVRAGQIFGIPISGTHAHSYVQSFSSLDEAHGLTLFHQPTQTNRIFLDTVLEYREKMEGGTTTNDGELAAFCNYACAFPDACLCLIDTYDTVNSGLKNFVCVAKALDDFGYQPKGVRLDSGDLVGLSLACQQAFDEICEEEPHRAEAFGSLTIVASNDINEKVLQEFSERGHALTAYGIGTNLVTCQAQPALGCVYKLVECKGEPRIKLSQELVKVTLPGRKSAYRFFGEAGRALVDYLCLADEAPPETGGSGILCRDPFDTTKRLRVVASRVEALHSVVFSDGRVTNAAEATLETASLSQTRAYVQKQLEEDFSDSLTSYRDPVSHPVMVSPKLFDYLHELWEKNSPVPEVR